jgi:mRNA-degrading endonuclease RelE of RelBE toxin-antitoxin system
MSNQYLLLIDKSVAKQLQKFSAKQYKQIVAKLLSLAFIPKLQKRGGTDYLFDT